MPVILLYGEEEYLLSRGIHQVRTQFVNPSLGNLSHKILTQPKIHEALEAVSSVSFALGGYMMYEIHDFQPLSKATASTADDKQLEEFKYILEMLPQTTVVLFVNTKISKTVKFTKWLLKAQGVDIREFKPLAFWETDKAVQQLISESRHLNIQLTPKAAFMLVEHMGTNLQPLINEVHKLAVFTAGKPIDAQHVTALSNHNENTFGMLSQWLHRKDFPVILQTLEELLLRQHPVQLFALIQSQLGHYFQIKLWQRLGQTENHIAERSGKHPFKIKKDLQELQAVSLERLDQLKSLALDMEWKAKTGQLDAKLALEVLLAS